MANQYQNPFADFLEETAESRRSALLSGQFAKQSQSNFDFLRSQFQAIDDLFKSRLAEQIKSGQAPTLRFSEGEDSFLSTFDPRRFTAQYTPQQRGLGQVRFVPAARFSFF